jgi:arsenite methyltransferase
MDIKAKMFNRKASDPKNKPDEIINALAIKEGDIILDIGSGGGYFSIRFAEIAGKRGHIYSIDTDKSLLEYIQKSAQEKNLNNIETILLDENELKIPDKKADLIFMRNVYHHLTDRINYFTKLKKILKPQGRIAIIEHKKKGGLSFRSVFKHYTTKETIIDEMKQTGLKLIKDFVFLPEQSFTIYNLKKQI